MKKIVSIVLLSAILLIGNIAFVLGSTLYNDKSKITQAVSDYKARHGELAHLRETVQNNRTEVLSLKANSSDAYHKAKSHLKELTKNKDNLSLAEIESLKEALNLIKQDRQSLADTIGEIQKATLGLRVAQREKNFEEVTKSLNSIITVQNTRIGDLQRTITDLNKAANL